MQCSLPMSFAIIGYIHRSCRYHLCATIVKVLVHMVAATLSSKKTDVERNTLADTLVRVDRGS